MINKISYLVSTFLPLYLVFVSGWSVEKVIFVIIFEFLLSGFFSYVVDKKSTRRQKVNSLIFSVVVTILITITTLYIFYLNYYYIPYSAAFNLEMLSVLIITSINLSASASYLYMSNSEQDLKNYPYINIIKSNLLLLFTFICISFVVLEYGSGGGEVVLKIILVCAVLFKLVLQVRPTK